MKGIIIAAVEADSTVFCTDFNASNCPDNKLKLKLELTFRRNLHRQVSLQAEVKTWTWLPDVDKKVRFVNGQEEELVKMKDYCVLHEPSRYQKRSVKVKLHFNYCVCVLKEIPSIKSELFFLLIFF